MTDRSASTPSRGRQALAALALVTTLLLAAAVIVILGRNLAWLLVALVGVAIAVAGLWWVLTERLPRRALGIVGLLVGGGVVVYAVLQATEGAQRPLVRLLILLALLVLTAVLGRAALAPDLHELDRRLDFRPFAPTKPVLLCNPWSGGGKVEKFGLKKMADEMGIETVFLAKGLDLAELARDAIARGADCLGMAGGDGSQALVASIAHEHDIPFVCISAGTRNHFAQDLGFDKEDPRKGMVAFRDGVERHIDLATVGDRLFVNNVSLGIYATIVQQDSYRDAKLETSRETLPKMLSSQAEPFDLQFTTPDGVEVDDSFVIMVSNNPYVLGPSLDLSQRRTMDSGTLGVFAVNARSGKEAAAMVTRSTVGLGGRDPHVHQFTTEKFEVRSRSGTCYAGVDGEALELDTPLVFRVQPRALKLLVPEDILRAAELRRARGFRPSGLVALALGRRPRSPIGAGDQAQRRTGGGDARIAAAAVGFDLGETLYHYRGSPLSWVEETRPALDRVIDACGLDRSKADVATAHKHLEDYSTYLRKHVEEVSAADVMTDVLTALGGDSSQHLETAVDAFFSYFRQGLEPYPDAVETLAALKRAGFIVGALSNVPFGMPRQTIAEDLERSGLAPYLDAFITSVDVGMRKPRRAPFEWLAATLGVEPRDMAYVGNLPTDVTGSLACGCTPILLDRTDGGLDYGQAATVHHLSEVPPLLRFVAKR